MPEGGPPGGPPPEESDEEEDDFGDEDVKAKKTFILSEYFMRREWIYLIEESGEVQQLHVSALKYADPLQKAETLPLTREEAMLQDVSMHLNFYSDFLVGNTILMLSHGKVLSIYDFSSGYWSHMLP